MKKQIILLLATTIISSCGSSDPISGLKEAERNFLFGDDESKITFMGWPLSGTEPSCNPSSMGQGYAFVMDGKSVLIESIRPNGTERHKVKQISSNTEGIDIKARNGANLPFNLKITNISDSGAFISFDGEANSKFVRCNR